MIAQDMYCKGGRDSGLEDLQKTKSEICHGEEETTEQKMTLTTHQQFHPLSHFLHLTGPAYLPLVALASK